MQRQIPVTPQPLELNPLKEMAQVNKIDYSVDFNNLYLRMDDFDKLFKTWQLHSTETKRKHVDDSYRNRKVIEFNVQLTANHFTNFQNVHLCFPMKIKLVADNDNDITAGIIPVNNLFTHWIKEIDIKNIVMTCLFYRYPIRLISIDILMNFLKHMSKDALKTIENDLLYSRKKVAIYRDDNDMRAHYTTTDTVSNRTDENLTEKIEKFQDQLKDEYVYRIPLKHLCDVGLVNQCFKFNTKYILTLEMDMQIGQITIKQQTHYQPLLMQATSLRPHLTLFTNNSN